MSRINNRLSCDICGKPGARIRRVAETFGKGGDLLLIENIPLVACPNCGEGYYTADTLHEIERIKAHRDKLSVRRAVKVARFAA